MFKQLILPLAATTALAMPMGSTALAANDGIKAQSPEIVKRGPDGRAQIVKVGGKEYQVCVNDRQDDCIQPRAAGLDWGDRPLRYWPGNKNKSS